MTHRFSFWSFFSPGPGEPRRLSKLPPILLLAALLLPAASHSQIIDTSAAPLSPGELVDSLWTVDTVLVNGNEHTKDFVIRREMSLQPGSRITKSLLAFDQNRIYSLRLFNKVDIEVVPTTPGFATLRVDVSERWYIFPFPILGLRDRDWKKVFFGAGLLHSNFLGRNEKLYAALVFGYDPAVSLSRTGRADMRAFEMGLARLRGMTDFQCAAVIQDSGPIEPEHIKDSLAVYKRGMAEVDRFLTSRLTV